MIELKAINKTYPSSQGGYKALDGIDLSIKAGEIFGIIGQSGAGKSTLLRIINLLEQPTSGRVSIDGCDITKLDDTGLRRLRRNIGFIFQHFNLLSSRTVAANIALPLEILGRSNEQIKQRVDELLDLVDLSSHQQHLPSQLSGGQKQRVAIARALATDPDILLCDEVTSALDSESTRKTLALLQHINQTLGKTIVLITHELDVIKAICDRTAVIDGGCLIELNHTIDLFVSPQHEQTKQLINHDFHIDIEKFKHCRTLVLLTFAKASCEQPLITRLIKEHDLVVNILQADICDIKGTSFGYTLCDFQGEASNIERAITYIHSTSIHIEVLKHD